MNKIWLNEPLRTESGGVFCIEINESTIIDNYNKFIACW